MGDEVRRVEPDQWVRSAADAVGQRWAHLDWLGVVDELGRRDELRVVIRLLDPATAQGIRLETVVSRHAPVLDSLTAILPGVGWHEREASDLFGVRFAAGDNRRLLVPDEGRPGELSEHPLRKDVVLAARVALPWPGAADNGDTTRRRMLPPGVPDPDVFGSRPIDAPPLDPAALVAPTRRRR